MPPRRPPASVDDSFTLHDLRVEVVATDRPMVCNHRAGDWFELSGENLRFPDGQTFPLYPLAALLPLLPAKQRPTHPHDWMTTDAEIACPDPHCGARFRITRIGTSTFSHAAVTAVPLPPPDPDARVKAALLPQRDAARPSMLDARLKAKRKAKGRGVKVKDKAKEKTKDGTKPKGSKKSKRETAGATGRRAKHGDR